MLPSATNRKSRDKSRRVIEEIARAIADIQQWSPKRVIDELIRHFCLERSLVYGEIPSDSRNVQRELTREQLVIVPMLIQVVAAALKVLCDAGDVLCV